MCGVGAEEECGVEGHCCCPCVVLVYFSRFLLLTRPLLVGLDGLLVLSVHLLELDDVALEELRPAQLERGRKTPTWTRERERERERERQKRVKEAE